MLNYAGQVLKSYELQELIDTGGFGAIYRANQTVVEREVAIKIIFPELANRPSFIRRFEAEAQLVAGLEHPYIVPLYDYWRDPDGAYIVMRWLRGGHLRTIMGSAPMQVIDVARILDQVGAALIFAHRYGVIHRDLKPENILLDEAGNAYLADFGIAQIISSTRGDDEMASMGSPAYAAPEQMRGQSSTPAADQYSLGVILYEMLAGQHPFPDLAEMTLTELTMRRISEPLPPLSRVRPDLPAAVGQVIQRATALNPAERYEDIATMLASFQAAIEPLIVRSRASALAAISRTQQIAALTADLPNPYKGLRTFQESDAANFFGRQALINRLVGRMRETESYSRFLAVIGPSGSGKSSVVKAGLIPALRNGAMAHSSRWYYVELTPGAQPFKELEAAITSIATDPPEDLDEVLMRDSAQLVTLVQTMLPPDQTTELFLLIDQFEELFTQVSEAERDRFLASLYHAVSHPSSRIRIVVTLRADFYDRPLLLPVISEMMRQRTEVIVPLTAEELGDAIIEPARKLGVGLESGLDNAIIQEVSDHRGALPLVQYLMSELFQRRQGMWMTLAAYQEMGGVRGALARRAEEIYESLNTEQRTTMRQLFLRLITLGEGSEDTRRRTLIAEVNALGSDPALMRGVIDVLGKARLLTFDRDPETRSPTVEVTHEALIREWGRLRDWLDASRGDVRLQRTLAALEGEWSAANRDPSYLLRDARLRQFETWSADSSVHLTELESEFLNTSLQEQRKRQTVELQRAQNERRLEQQSRTRLSILVAVMAIALLVGVVLTGFALAATQRAQVESQISQSLAQAASAERALSEGDSDLAIVLAVAANSADNAAPQALRTLTEVAFSPGTRSIFTGAASFVTAVDIDPRGRYVAGGSRDSLVRVWSIDSETLLHTLAGHRGDVQAVAFSPDGRYLATGGLDFTAILWDVETGTEAARFVGHNAALRALVFSPDGTTLVTGSRDNTLIVWDIASGTPRLTLTGHSATVQAVAFNSDGTRIASGAGNGEISIWDGQSGERMLTWTSSANGVNDLAYLDDDSHILSALGDGTLVTWDATNGDAEQVIRVEDVPLSMGVLEADQQVFVGLRNGQVAVVNLASGQASAMLRGHLGEVYGAALNRDGRLGVSGGSDGTVRVWNVTNPAEQARIVDHAARITGLAFAGSAESPLLVSVSVDQTLRIRPFAGGNSVRTVELGAQVRALGVMPDGASVFAGLSSGAVARVDLASETVTETYPIHAAPVLALTVSPNGMQAASSAQGEAVRVWNARTGATIQELTGYAGTILDLAFSPDSTQLAFGVDDNSIVIRSLVENNEIRRLTGSATPISALAFSPDGSRIAGGARDGTVLVWDARTGAIVYRVSGHTRDVWSMSFTADGAGLLTTGGDGVLVWWNAATGEEIERFQTAVAPALRVAIDPSGEYAVTGADRGTVQVWRLYDGSSLIDWTRANRYLRDLTCQERTLYRVQPLCENVG